MAEHNPDGSVRLVVQGGVSARIDAIVGSDLPGDSGLRPGDRVWLREDGGRQAGGGPIPGQVDAAGRLVWVVPGEIWPGERRTFVATRGSAEVSAEGDVKVEEHPAILIVSRNGRTIAHYNFRSVWKPYLCPLNGPVGNVVRGASAEHQHQAGLYFSYGGHFTPTNIWSDWDEPIYGPDGKMLHREFERRSSGPVFAEIVERVGYLAADGSTLLEERRSIQFYPLADGTTVLDFLRTCPRPAEPSDGPFNLSVRVADPPRTVDNARRAPLPERAMLPTDDPGQMESSRGETTQGESLESERWLDRSGRLVGGWGGIAFCDHPANPGYPGRLSAAGYGTMGLSYRFPADADRVTWRYRVVAHAGDAARGRIEQRWQDYAEPLTVEKRFEG